MHTMSAPTTSQFTFNFRAPSYPDPNRDHDLIHNHQQASFITPRSLPREEDLSSIPAKVQNQVQVQNQPTTATATTAITQLTLSLDATVIRSWHDTSEYSLPSSNSNGTPLYHCIDLLISSFPSPSNRILARYAGGKLKKDALYQFQGRLFIDSQGLENGYFHIDVAVRFQGPGVLRSFRVPEWKAVGEVLSLYAAGEGRGWRMAIKWETRDPYRRGMVYEQNAILRVELQGEKKIRALVGKVCELEGRMEGLDPMGDWICTGIEACEMA